MVIYHCNKKEKRNMNKKFIPSLLLLLSVVCGQVMAQGASRLVINEVMTNNETDVVDQYGNHNAWIEINNNSYAIVDIRNCYLTNNRAVLNKNLSVPERTAMMYSIPKGNITTKMEPKQQVSFWCDGHDKRGVFFTNFTLNSGESTWIGLYDANGTTLIDSLTVPVLQADQSYALKVDGKRSEGCIVKAPGEASFGENNLPLDFNSKIQSFKREDSHGYGMTVMAMFVTFSALLLLFIAFFFLGRYMIRSLKHRKAVATGVAEPAEIASGEVYAAIAMALHEENSDVHDWEETILTINRVKRNYSPWSSKIYTLRENPRR